MLCPMPLTSIIRGVSVLTNTFKPHLASLLQFRNVPFIEIPPIFYFVLSIYNIIITYNSILSINVLTIVFFVVTLII